MKYKCGFIFICLIICLFSIASVCASDVNETMGANEDQSVNVINVENQNENDFSVETIDEISDDEDNKILSAVDDEENLSYNVDEDVLGASPPYNKYSVSVSDTTLNYGQSGSITISITPASSSYSYRYDFYLKVYDSSGTEKISKRYYSTSYSTKVTYSVGSTSLSPGFYTIKILNYYDNRIMTSASLTVKSVPYSAYSVSVSSTTLNYGSSGSITMSITPASSSYYYKYDFYLKVYDSSGTEKISKRYYSTSSSNKVTYSVGSTNLAPGSYTIKILNNVDNHVMATASLTVKSVPYSAYSVSVSSTTLNYGTSGPITMSITPASSSYYYRYDFYLKVYDSSGTEKISKRYYSTSSSNKVTYSVGSTSLPPGSYTIKILNNVDNHVMATASLTVKSVPYSAYSVSVSDMNIINQESGSITMSITPASSSYYYKYDFYLKVYDSSGTEKISKRYYSTSSSNKVTYSVGSTSLPQGIYTIKILNNVDNHVMDMASLNVKSVNIESNDASGWCDQVLEYKVRVLENGEYKSGLSIIFTCNGKKYTVPTDYEGYATLNIHLKSGTYTITTNYQGFVKNNSIVVNSRYVDNKYRNVVINAPNAYFKENKKITYGWEGNLKGSFNIYKGDSLIYSTKLDTSGYITDYFEYKKHSYSYPIKNIPSTGLYTVKIISSNGKVLAKSTFRITKATTKTIGKSFTTLCGFKNTVRVDVYDKQGNHWDIGGKAKFKIGKKVYKAKVKHGSAKVKVKFSSKKKTYKCKVKFLGDKNYKGSSAKFKIKATKIKNPVKVGKYSIKLTSKQYKSISKAVLKGKHKSKIVKTKYSKKFKKPYLKKVKHYKKTKSCYTIYYSYYTTMNRMKANGWTKVSEYKYDKKNPRNKYGIGLSAYTYAITKWVKVSYKTAYKAKYYPVKAKITTKGTPMKNPKIKVYSHGKTLSKGKVVFA